MQMQTSNGGRHADDLQVAWMGEQQLCEGQLQSQASVLVCDHMQLLQVDIYPLTHNDEGFIRASGPHVAGLMYNMLSELPCEDM